MTHSKWHGNQFVRSWKVKLWKLAKRVALAVVILDGIGWAYVGGYYYAKANIAPEVVQAEVRVEVPVDTDAPVLSRIAKCESGDEQFDKSGQVLVKVNANKTYDTGRYQINSIWNKQATKLGLNLTDEKDNLTMARWIYANRGTGDWSASQACWSK